MQSLRGIRARALCNVAIFLAALCLACAAIHSSLPVPEISEVREKLDFLQAHIDEYDTLFLGTSRVYHGIMPEVFDEANRRAGAHSRSFNAGVDGMHPPEDLYFFEQIAKMRPRRLRRVFIEVNAIQIHVRDANRGTDRMIYWHDLARLAWILRETFDIEPAKHWRATFGRYASAAAEALPTHIDCFLQNMSNIGRGAGSRWFLAGRGGGRSRSAELGGRGDGYFEMPRSEMTPSERANYAMRTRNLLSHPRESEYGSAPSQKLLRQFVQAVRAIGAEPVLLVMPRTAYGSMVPKPSEGPWPVVFNFENPARYPALYEESTRADGDHFNGKGAKLFTEMLAQAARVRPDASAKPSKSSE